VYFPAMFSFAGISRVIGCQDRLLFSRRRVSPYKCHTEHLFTVMVSVCVFHPNTSFQLSH